MCLDFLSNQMEGATIQHLNIGIRRSELWLSIALLSVWIASFLVFCTISRSEYAVHIPSLESHNGVITMTLPMNSPSSNRKSDRVTVARTLTNRSFKNETLHLQDIMNNYNLEVTHIKIRACKVKSIDFLFVVPSAPDNTDIRTQVRESELYKFAQQPASRAVLMFFIGWLPEHDIVKDNVQHKIDNEVKLHMDIIQRDCTDVHQHVRLKAVSMLLASRYCSNATYIVRTVDKA